MREITIPLALLVALTACKAEPAALDVRSTRTVIVEPKHIDADRQAVGEVKPRYESDLSFRVAGKVLVRRVDVGASVRQGDTLATLDTQDFQNRLRSGEAEVASAEAELVETQGNEARKAKLLKDGFTPQATYDTALRNLRSAEARLTSAKANLALAQDQLRYTDLKADFDAVITAVGAEPGQNVNAGQMVAKLIDQVTRMPFSASPRPLSLVTTRPASMWKSSSGRCPTPTLKSKAQHARSLPSPTPRHARIRSK
jgi:RND family efflux transporter MFP subunit